MLLLVFTINFFEVQTVVASDGTEVYDIRKGEVVLTIQNSNSLQNLVKDWLSSAIGIAGWFRIEPNDGIAIKIPLTPPYKVQNKWITGTVTEVIMFVGRSKTYYPTLLVLTKENHLMAVYIKDHNLENFLKENKLYSSELNLSAPRCANGLR
jgi:predicted ATP-grasp superfamily ATP-dependent carboligase